MQCVFMSLYDSKSQTAILMDVYVTTVMWHVCGGEQQVGPVVVLATPGTGALLGQKAPTESTVWESAFIHSLMSDF